MNDYIKTWEYLHQNNYFQNHHLYNKFQILQPHNIKINDIQGKSILDIGAGYGRMMGWFCQYAEFVYGIEVSNKIINEAKKFLKCKKFKNFMLLSYDDYIDALYDIDYVFCRYVFQHISKEQCREYISNIEKILQPNGIINLQFRIGQKSYHSLNKEPRTEYTIKEIKELLQNFQINKLEFTQNKEHLFILGTKI